MRYLVVLVLLFTSHTATANILSPHVGGICHVEAEYYYPGVWEKYGENELICNYWKFLGDADRESLGSQFSDDETSDSDRNDDSIDYGDYDDLDDMQDNSENVEDIYEE